MANDLPKEYKKLLVTKLSTNFREAVVIASAPLPQPGETQILVKNRYVGVNATDINISAGRYNNVTLPYEIGLEGVGEVAAVGKRVTSFKVGDSVGYIHKDFCRINGNAYAEYSVISEESTFHIPEVKPEYVALVVSGLTSAIGLDKYGRITEGETVLITAAAGGTGHIAVQWAKAAGCHVIGTCSSEKKVEILKNLGCDRVINYKKEDIDSVLSEEYSKGVDVIWETIGGEVFETCLNHLALKGRLIILGGIMGYKTDAALPEVNLPTLPRILLSKSASVLGFIVLMFGECFPAYFTFLKDRMLSKELSVLVDDGKESRGKEFVGLNGVIEAIEHLQSGASIGKVIARIS